MAATRQPTGHPTTSDKLESHAATSALSSARAADASHSTHSALDERGKLSSAGAATSLKYARAQDLPSFPSAGLQMSSAGAAASLAESNKKSFEHWKPGEIPAANKAALLAKDYEMSPLWRPEMSAAGSRAAILAHRDGGRHGSLQESKPAEPANPAKPLNSKSPNVNTEAEIAADSHRKALLAATGAMSAGRPRAGSAPVDPKDARAWALRAATKSHGSSSPPLVPFASGDPGFEAARIQNIARNNVSRQMYGSTPPVSMEVDEKSRQDMLKASAIAMAQKMYAIQQQQIDEAAGVRKSDGLAAASKMRSRTMSTGSSNLGGTPGSASRYENLEEAARRLAQEKLSKLHDEHAEYRNYYGQAGSPRSRIGNRLRRRASSGGAQDDDSDEEQSRRIRSQMSLFQSKLAEVDSKKRQADRDALLQAAHRNVTAEMRKMDERVFQDTGKASPAQMEMWEKAARDKAQRESDERMQHAGKVHIGGGKYLDQSEVDAIAKARLQPTLDDINDRAEKQRARDEEIRLEQERLKDQAEKDKAREAEVKAELKAANEKEKYEQKLRRDEEKRVEKERISAEKEQAKLEKEEKRRSREHKGRFSALLGRGSAGAAAGVVGGTAAGVSETDHAPKEVVADDAHAPAVPERPTDHASPTDEVAGEAVPDTTADDAASDESSVIEAHYIASSPTRAGESRVKSWLKKPKFRSGNKLHKHTASDSGPSDETAEPQARESSDQDRPKSDSIRDVAMAGRTSTRETDDMYEADEPVSPIKDTPADNAASRSPSISSLSDAAEEPTAKQHPPQEGDAEGSRGRKSGFRQRLLSKINPNKDKAKETEADKGAKAGLEPTSTNADNEVFEEARDTFKEEKLAPPPPLSTMRVGSPVGSRDGSKFREQI